MSIGVLESTDTVSTTHSILDHEEDTFLTSLSERIAAKAPGDVYDPLPWIIIDR
jgi:hypothetical protein